MSRYQGKTVVITGGGTGLGRGMACAFAREGATVAVLGRRQEKLDETVALIDTNAFGLSCDVRDATRVAEVMQEIHAKTGRIDVLVNNAAGNFVAPSEQLSPNGFKAIVDIVLLGTFNCTRTAFDALKATKGVILNIIAAYAWSGEPAAVHSACAKAGVLAMTRTLAAEWGRYGIRANAIAPGPIHTEGTDANLWSVVNAGSSLEETVRKQIPLGRLGTPEDVARAALWLCSAEAEWITGATLTVDGGHWLNGGVLDLRGAWDAAQKR